MKLVITITLLISIGGSFSASPTENINYRLTDDIEPIHYTIELTPYFNNETADKEAFTFDGKVQIEFKTSKTGVKTITLHQEDLNITNQGLSTKPSQFLIFQIVISGEEYDLPTKKLTLKLTEELVPNKIYVLFFEYTGKLRTDMNGFYRSSYTEGNVKKWLASTQMQPVHARKAFPCFDEPRFKATFDIIINRPSYFSTTISNTRVKQTNFEGSTGLIREQFERTPKMSTYLVAFVVSEFRCRENDYENFTVCSRPPAYDQTEYSFEIGQKTLANFDQYFDYKYNEQMSKMHMVAIPDFAAGAMENWGLLTYRETALLYQPNVSTSIAQQRVAAVVAHEQTHMWFGDLVTCDWWSHTWLNEGFARYFQYFGLHMVEPSWGLDQQFVVEQQHSVFGSDSLDDTLPLSHAVSSPDEIADRFGSISYNKGGSVIRMVEHTLGKQTFRAALRDYLKTNALSTSVPDKLYAAFQKQVGNDVIFTSFFGSWVSQPGYPVLFVRASSDRKTITLTQNRFLRNYNQQENRTDRILWRIPITYATNKDNVDFSSTETRVFLTDETTEIELTESVDWILFNVQKSGYFRVNYDDESWSAINKVLLESHTTIHVLNRAQLIDDALNLARARHLNYKRALATVRYLKMETDYVPWLSAFNNFGFILARFKDDEAPEFKSFVLDLLTNVYNHLGFQRKETDSRLDIYNRVNILNHACQFGHQKCIEDARAEFDKLVQGESVPADLRPVVYCSSIAEGSKKEWNFLWQKLKQENVAAEQVVILNALGCTKKLDLTKNYLDLILTDAVRLQDKHAAFVSTLKQRENLELVLDYVIEHHKQIKEVFESETEVPSIMASVLTRITTEEQFERISKFSKNNELDSNRKLQTALRDAKFNLEWAEENLQDIKTGIRDDKSGESSASANIVSSTLLLSLLFVTYFHY